MATNPKNQPSPPGPKKSSSRMDEVQRRAATIASRKSVSPRQFLQEAWVELKKTSWPNKTVLTKSTYVVLGLVLAVAIWVGGLDYILTRVMSPLFNTH